MSYVKHFKSFESKDIHGNYGCSLSSAPVREQHTPLLISLLVYEIYRWFQRHILLSSWGFCYDDEFLRKMPSRWQKKSHFLHHASIWKNIILTRFNIPIPITTCQLIFPTFSNISRSNISLTLPLKYRAFSLNRDVRFQKSIAQFLTVLFENFFGKWW